MSFKTEFFIYDLLFLLFGVVLRFFRSRRLLQGDERRAVFTLLGSTGCFLTPYLLVRVVKDGEDNGDDTTEPRP